jgi:two-component system chemotaxis sensor kinase CheA
MLMQTQRKWLRARLGARGYGPVTIAVLFAMGLAVLLTAGMRLSAQIQNASSALKLTSEQQAAPDYLGAQVDLLQRGLETRAYIGELLRDLRASIAHVDTSLAGLNQLIAASNMNGDKDVARELALFARLWDRYRERMASVAAFDRPAYRDTDTGSVLTPAGRALAERVATAAAFQEDNAPQLRASSQALSSMLQKGIASRSTELRGLLAGGAAAALAMLALMLYFAWRARVQFAATRRAEKQTTNILSTVRDGLFLLDRDLRIGSVASKSLADILRQPDSAGKSFADVLRPLVSEKTLDTALKFVKLLWKHRVNENLIESVNPLNEIEVHFDSASGGREVRFVQFTFKRVRGASEEGEFLLGCVSDITQRVRLARELEQTREQAQGQMELVMQVLSVDATQLEAFVRETDVTLRKTNSILKTVGRDDASMQNKVNSFFREVHSVKGEAAALGLQSVVSRAHALEEGLAALRSKPSVDGNDFLPMVVQLNELMSHVSVLTEISSRLSAIRPGAGMQAAPAAEARARVAHDSNLDGTLTMAAAAAPARVAHDSNLDGTLTMAAVKAPTAERHWLSETLEKLTSHVCEAQGKRAVITSVGLEQVPQPYRRAVKIAVVQLLRNAIVHGIESPSERKLAGKPEAGSLSVKFRNAGAEGCALSFRDDGRGLSYEKILDSALRNGIVTPDDATRLDRGAVLGLIFKPNLSTADEVTEDAGRGVGLDVVATAVRELQGRIAVESAVNRGTRFTMTLPPAEQSATAVA